MRMTLLALLLCLPLNAFAEPILYNINFMPTFGAAPTGFFTWDPVTQTMTDPVIYMPPEPFNIFLTVFGNPTCLAGRTGDAAAFALLNGECITPGFFSRYEMTTAGTYYYFRIFSATPSGTVEMGRFFDPFYDGIFDRPSVQGAWTISPVPEPWSAAMVLLGIVFGLRLLREHAKR